MTNYTTGAEALQALKATSGGSEGSGGSSKYTSFKSGSKFVVRAMTTNDIAAYYAYSIFGKVDTFVPTVPPTFDERGFPKANLTVWDKATKHYTELMFKEEDKEKKKEHQKNASLYRGRTRFAFGLIDLDTGTPIYLDLSKPQAKIVHSAIAKTAEKGKLGAKAFELEKAGVKKDTVVTMTQIDLDDLTEKQQANFERVNDFDAFSFDGLNYEADEAEQIKQLKKAEFDLALIGLADDAPKESAEERPKVDVHKDDLPF